MVISNVLERLQKHWTVPRSAIHQGEPTFFQLRCVVDEPASSSTTRPEFQIPEELDEFWCVSAGARLFEDAEYGQWGLVLLGPHEVSTETERFHSSRPNDFVEGDLILGRFLGDQDLLLMRCNPEERDFGQLLIALPIDTRRNWYRPASNLADFLEAYEQAEGAKYWEDNSDNSQPPQKADRV